VIPRDVFAAELCVLCGLRPAGDPDGFCTGCAQDMDLVADAWMAAFGTSAEWDGTLPVDRPDGE
jgi:hypothetical protein